MLHGTYVGNGRMLVQTVFGAKLLAPSDDLGIMPDLVTEGTYDVPFTNYLRRELSQGQVALDVGANIGLFTLLMAWQVGATGAVVAYEPEPRNLELLRSNIALNYAETWVEVRPCGASDAAGEVTLHRTARFQGSHSLLPLGGEAAGVDAGIESVDPITIAVEPLDRLVGRFEQVDLVKVDVEGAEARVLRGARQLLGSGVLRRLSIEVNQPRAGDEWDALVTELRELGAAGWTFATIDGEGTPQPIALDRVIAEGRFAQILIER